MSERAEELKDLHCLRLSMCQDLIVVLCMSDSNEELFSICQSHSTTQHGHLYEDLHPPFPWTRKHARGDHLDTRDCP